MFQFKTDTDLFTFLKDKCTVLNIVISGDGKYFATTATDRKVRLCSVHTHTHTYTHITHYTHITDTSQVLHRGAVP